MARTNITKRLEEHRLSKEVQDFKKQVIDFLLKTEASDKFIYRVKCDLSKKIDMPFYGDRKERTSLMTDSDAAKEYVILLIKYDKPSFTEELLSWLTKQQNQTFRRIHKIPKSQKLRREKFSKKGVYEHPVPVNHSKKILVEYINNGNSEEALSYIDFLEGVPQIFLTTEEDNLVNRCFKDKIPDDWDWRKDDPFARYVKAGIDRKTYESI